MRRAAVIVAAGVLLCAGIRAGPERVQRMPPAGERAYQAVSSRFDSASAFEIVSFMDQYWRLAGNLGFNASIDHIRDRLLDAGFSTAVNAGSTIRVDEFANEGHGWDYKVGTVTFEDDEPGGEPLLSRERDRVSLAINSFPTVPGGVRARLVDLAGATAAEYEGKDIAGAIVLTDAPLGRVWQEAVKKRGAAGVISTAIARYVRPPGTTQLTEEQKDVLQWDSIPFDDALRSFGFKCSWRSAVRMRQRLSAGAVLLHVRIESSFANGPNRTLVAEIRGRTRPGERIVMVAHIQEPGASDNGSGCGTLYALARALNESIAIGALPPPERTLTFVWGDEVNGSREWIRGHPDEAARVRYMFALDMTGEDTGKTGGTFLIEKQADPSAAWPRPSDPHSEWGGSNVPATSLKGSLLNDLHLAVCRRRARDNGWIVRTNPYEGGSDHTVFAKAGVASLLNWHFTDRYYHTNQDRLDKVSAAEMANVATAVGTSAWVLAAADDRDARAVADIVAQAAEARLALERAQGRRIVEAASDRQQSEVTERQVLEAWTRWYGEALDTVLELPVAPASAALRREVAAARARLH
jgi:aminopeptidase YwaD